MKPKTGPVKFLVVDDREENLVALEALLRRDGLEILTARSGDEALELLLAHDFALALLDVQMPGMDGFTLAELMRGTSRSKHVPIIFVTAATEERTRVFQGYDAGAVDFLFKPIDPRILHHKTETFFRLFKQRQELEETIRLSETFMAAVGHDLKNPLNSVMMAADLLLLDAADPKTVQVATRLKSASKRMQRMIDDLFDLARARLAGGIPIEHGPTDLSACAKRVVAELEVANPGRRIQIDEEGDTHGEWDAARITQVLSNLIGNAIRHGTPSSPIAVVLRGLPDRVTLAVHNEGTIPPEMLPHVFEPFRSGDERRARSEGLGLGLHIVEQVLLAHGATIGVTSTQPEGTTFHVALPRTPPPLAAS